MNVDGTDATTITFTGMRIGEPAPSRYLILPIGFYRNGNITLNSITVDGVASTLHINSAGTASQSGNAIAGVSLPAKSEVNVAITFNSAYTRLGIAAYLLTGLKSTTPVATGTDTGTPFNLVISSLPLDSIVICCAKSESSNTALDFEWMGGIREDDEMKTESSGYNFSVASMYVRSSGELALQADHSGVVSNIGRGSYIVMR